MHFTLAAQSPTMLDMTVSRDCWSCNLRENLVDIVRGGVKILGWTTCTKKHGIFVL